MRGRKPGECSSGTGTDDRHGPGQRSCPLQGFAAAGILSCGYRLCGEAARRRRPARYHRLVRRLLTWLLVTLGVAALVRKLRRRAEASSTPAVPETPAAHDHADELRRKLAESRADEPEAVGAVPEGSVDERRADIHAEGRAKLDEMRSSSDS